MTKSANKSFSLEHARIIDQLNDYSQDDMSTEPHTIQ